MESETLAESFGPLPAFRVAVIAAAALGLMLVPAAAAAGPWLSLGELTRVFGFVASALLHLQQILFGIFVAAGLVLGRLR